MSDPQPILRSTVPLLPLRDGVLFPGTALSVPIGRARSVALVEAIQEGDIIGVGSQRDGAVSDPGMADLIPLGTYARVIKIARLRRKRYQLMLEGIQRFRIDGLEANHPFWRVRAEPLIDRPTGSPEEQSLVGALESKLEELGASFSQQLRERLRAARIRANAGLLADIVASALNLSTDKELSVFLALDVVERLRKVYEFLLEAETIAQLKEKIDSEVRKEFGKNQREAVLRQQLAAIRKELGEDDDGPLAALQEKLAAKDLPDEVRKVVDKELGRAQGLSGNHAEFHVIVKYLEFIASLPWGETADATLDIGEVEATLEADHYGLEDVKKRILEHLAVLEATGTERGAILCLVGPPGVGKTSLGKSIAEATDRPFLRVSLGGVRDEADIRGHRRTYVGALPGRILDALSRAEVNNPVMLLDEIDKLGRGWAGSPEAALLEVLDPEQNHTFTDHYLDLPYDLSQILFICTANTLETLSPPLRDRLEIIELSGYTVDEKTHIARRHLLPKKLADHGLTNDAVTLTDDALTAVIRDYTREAGVRQLTRELTKICRAVTLQQARDPERKGARLTLDRSDLREYLGKQKFFNDVAERTAIAGIATGLAWTPVGGDILFIETSRMRGKGKLEITGQLGDVMKESARAALTYVRSRAEDLGVDPDFLDQQDIHVHVPAGAVPKDGPSAGVTIFTALTSLLTGRRVRSDTAMTGECTLRGRVLPVGGIKAKVLAAHRAGLTRVILPAKNERDIDDVPAEVREEIEFIFAGDMDQVLAAALETDAGMPLVGDGHTTSDGTASIRVS